MIKKAIICTTLLLYLSLSANSQTFSDIDLTQLTKEQGFRIIGESPNGGFSRSLSHAGDINGDGIHNFLISEYLADPSSIADAGNIYVIFGTQKGFPEDIDLRSELTPGQGFKIIGIYLDSNFGFL